MVRKIVRVQADHSYSNRFDEVAKGLKDAGLTVQDEISVLGHFSGVADADAIEKIKAVPGVASVDVAGDEGAEEVDDYSITDSSESNN